jgi:hypothetical protein
MAVTDQAPAAGLGAGPAKQTGGLVTNFGLLAAIAVLLLVMALGAIYWRWLGYV